MIASRVFVLRPAAFGFDPKTAETNAFQQAEVGPESGSEQEFDQLVNSLLKQGVEVDVLEDDPDLKLPNAVFLNNWFSTHPDGLLITYPMLTESRRPEVRADLVSYFKDRYRVSKHLDLRSVANEGEALEGTGSLVFDHLEKCAYLCWSLRSSERLARIVCDELGYRLFSFEGLDASSQPIYHTNVLLSIGETRILLVTDAVSNEVTEHLRQVARITNRTLVELNHEQMSQYSANALEILGSNGPVLFLSDSGWSALEPGQQRQLLDAGPVQTASIPTFERLGGGSVRCMIAENYWSSL